MNKWRVIFVYDYKIYTDIATYAFHQVVSDFPTHYLLPIPSHTRPIRSTQDKHNPQDTPPHLSPHTTIKHRTSQDFPPDPSISISTRLYTKVYNCRYINKLNTLNKVHTSIIRLITYPH